MRSLIQPPVVYERCTNLQRFVCHGTFTRKNMPQLVVATDAPRTASTESYRSVGLVRTALLEGALREAAMSGLRAQVRGAVSPGQGEADARTKHERNIESRGLLG